MELARDGSCSSIAEIRRVLTREHYEGVAQHLDGSTLKKQLFRLLAEHHGGAVPQAKPIANRNSPRPGVKPWRPEDDEQLMRLRAEGVDISTLSLKFGRSQGAIETRLSRLRVKLGQKDG